MREGTNLPQFCFFFWGGGGVLNVVQFPWKLGQMLVKCPLGTSETSLCFMLVHPTQSVPSLGVPLRQIQSVAMLMYYGLSDLMLPLV